MIKECIVRLRNVYKKPPSHHNPGARMIEIVQGASFPELSHYVLQQWSTDLAVCYIFRAIGLILT